VVGDAGHVVVEVEIQGEATVLSQGFGEEVGAVGGVDGAVEHVEVEIGLRSWDRGGVGDVGRVIQLSRWMVEVSKLRWIDVAVSGICRPINRLGRQRKVPSPVLVDHGIGIRVGDVGCVIQLTR